MGHRFLKSGAGACNGNFLGIGADDCWTAVVVEQSEPYWLLITNGEFVSQSKESVVPAFRDLHRREMRKVRMLVLE